MNSLGAIHESPVYMIIEISCVLVLKCKRTTNGRPYDASKKP